MRELLHSEVARVEFSIVDGEPDATPTAGCYAGTTLLGSATVTALSGTRNYSATYTLPSSGITPYTVISFRVDVVVDAVDLPTTHLVAGELVAARRNATTPPTASENATAVRTELSTELTDIGDIDTRTSNIYAVAQLTDADVSSIRTTVEGLVAAIWSAGTRTLTAISDSSGITTLLTRIVGTLASGTHQPQSGDAFAANVVFTGTVSAGNTGWVTVDNPPAALATANLLEGCLLEIAKPNGTRQYRWVRAHFLSSGDAGFNPDADFTSAPANGDTITIYKSARWTSNVTYWRSNQPGNTDSNGFLPANLAAINGSTLRATRLADAMDASLLAKLNVPGTLANTDNADQFKATIDLTSVTSSLTTIENRVTAERAAKLDRDIAEKDDVSPSVAFNPTINPTPVTVNPTPVTVNPTVLSPLSVDQIRDGLATQSQINDVTTGLNEVLIAVGGTVIGGGGRFAISVLVNETDERPVRSAAVWIEGSADIAYTDQFGRATLYAESDTYTVICQPPISYVMPATQEVTVNDAAAEVTFNVAKRLITSTELVEGTCLCSLFMRTVSGADVDGARVSVTATSPFRFEDDTLLHLPTLTGVTANGVATFELRIGVTYTVTVSYGREVPWTFKYIVPQQTEAVIRSITIS